MIVAVADTDVECHAPVELFQILFRIRAGLQNEVYDVQITFPLGRSSPVPESQMGEGRSKMDALSVRSPVETLGKQNVVFLSAFCHTCFCCNNAALAGEHVAEMLPKFGIVTVAARGIFRYKQTSVRILYVRFGPGTAQRSSGIQELEQPALFGQISFFVALLYGVCSRSKFPERCDRRNAEACVVVEIRPAFGFFEPQAAHAHIVIDGEQVVE